MYAKINGGTVVKFPYTFGDLRKDNPNVSFPRNIPQGVMQRYGMVAVTDGTKPDCGLYQRVERNVMPTRPVIGQYTEDDAPLPEMVGEDIISSSWVIEYSVVDLTAEEIAEKDAATSEVNRRKRNRLLVETDWMALSDVTMSAEMTTYRQALRDITDHANFPHLDEADWPVKP